MNREPKETIGRIIPAVYPKRKHGEIHKRVDKKRSAQRVKRSQKKNKKSKRSMERYQREKNNLRGVRPQVKSQSRNISGQNRAFQTKPRLTRAGVEIQNI